MQNFLSVSHRVASALILLTTFFAAAPAFGDELGYRFEPKQVVPYKVRIVAESPTSKTTMNGMIAFTGKKAEQDKFTVSYTGSVSRKTQTRNAGRSRRGGFPRFGGPPVPMGPPGFGRGVSFGGLTRTTNEVVVGSRGKIYRITGQSQLPFLLGNLSVLPFEALPNGDQTEWSVSSGLSITEEDDSPFFGGPFRGSQTTKTGGSESATYKVQSDDGKLVKIEKTYQLLSPAAGKNDEAIEIKGTGIYTFNRELGVPESLDMKQTLIVTEAGSSVSVPMTVAWHRIPAEEYQASEKERADRLAKAKKDLEERQARARAAAKEAAGKKLDPEKKKQIMADLNSSHWPAVANRVRSLSSFIPHPDDFDVALRIKELRSHKVVGVYLHARKLWDKLEPVVEAGQKEKKMAADASNNPFVKADEKALAKAKGMREWSDNTGSFKVEAEFVKFDGDNIVIKRKDGEELTVPLDRLSEADQKIADTLRKSASATEKPVNPFKPANEKEAGR